MDTEKRNLIILVGLSLAILGGFHFFYEKPRLEAELQSKTTVTSVQESAVTSTLAQIVEKTEPAVERKIFSIENSDLRGTFTNQGFEFSDVVLKNFKETTDPQSPLVPLLNRQSSKEEGGFFAEFEWLGEDTSLKMPDAQTLWTVVEGSSLSPETPVVMTWDNGQGVEFKRVVELDDKSMFTIRQTVNNKSGKAIRFKTQGRIVRLNPTPGNYVVLHEGAVGYLDGGLKEVKYEDLKKTPQSAIQTRGGWLGITDKYWLVALVPDQNLSVGTHFQSKNTLEGTTYEASSQDPLVTVEPGNNFTATTRLFVGPKSLDLLDYYENVHNIPHFDLAIDFGWFYFITKPLFFAVKWLFDFLGNFGLAIVVLTILVRLSFYPLANHSFHAMAKMRELQPQIARLKEIYGEDKQRFQQEMMGLYKKHKVNPVAGCVPVIIQVPVFFALYKVLFVVIEMRHAPFYGWIRDLSAPDPLTIFNLFGLIPWTPPSFLMIGILPLLMSATMMIQQSLNPPPTDPIQEKFFKLMPWIFLFMLANFPAGLVIYWICSNLFSIAQQWVQNNRTHKKMSAGERA